jgi:2,3-bisphosphoglycerate-independent phosphoglycerate mutase
MRAPLSMVVQRITMKKANPVILVILDGFGYSSHTHYNAIALANKPFLDFAFQNFPHTLLEASGAAVGLPPGYAGNSEVGHTTLGAGTRIPSSFLQLHTSIEDKSFFTNPELVRHLQMLAQSGYALQILGICSDAGVHGDTAIILASIKAALDHKVKKIIIHAFLDGQDVPAQSANTYLNQIQQLADANKNVIIGSITGRWYAMDRDNHADRTGATFDMLTQENSAQFTSWQQALDYYYQKNITDTYIPPTLLSPDAIIQNGDGLLFTNFRKERERQLVARFLTPTHTCPKIAFVLSSVQYDPHFNNPTLLKTKIIPLTLKEKISKRCKTIFSIAETEKSAHITFFFDGSREQLFPGETRLFIPSPAVANFADAPQMSAQKITDAVVASLQTDPADFYLINYANADMVGHSGNFPATITAIECLDSQLKQLYDELVTKMDGTLIITADHGNAENMVDEKTGQPNPAHTTHKVPFILIKNELIQKKVDLSIHELADVAPLVLKQF